MAQPVWTTAAGSLGIFSSSIQLVATAVLPATTVTYTLLSGSLPPGLVISSSGLISGTPDVVNFDTTTAFTIRATDNLSNIRDRTFSLIISGDATPAFTSLPGNLISPYPEDSTWLEFQVGYSNPDTTNPVAIILQGGALPPGLEIDGSGMIRGYAVQPTMGEVYTLVTTEAYLTDATTNSIRCVSTNLFTVGRPVVFTAPTLSVIVPGVTYYVSEIVNTTAFTISETQYGYVLPLTTDVGAMAVTLPVTTVDLPTITTYMFELALLSPLGNTTQLYSITVVNQDVATPGITRIPTVLNTRPLSFNVTSDIYYRYYVLPPVLPAVEANIGLIQNNEYFAFKMIGYDFEGGALTYSYFDLPAVPGAWPTAAGSFETGKSYTIDSLGDTDFTLIGAVSNIVRLSFTATGTGEFDASAIVAGLNYTITATGNTNWNLFAGTTGLIYSPGMTITAMVSGSDIQGTGTAIQGTGTATLSWLAGHNETGWITGTPSIASEAEVFNFSVKVTNSGEDSATFNFTTTVTNNISVTVTWMTPGDLGTIYNGTVSTFNIQAFADVPLTYSLVSGTLPPNLTLLANGEIVGCAADQPTDILLSLGDTTEFTFTARAQSTDPLYSMITSDRTFTITVLQEFAYPTDTLYCEATTSIADRKIINSLLTNNTLIPDNYLYRPDDIYFGKATGVIYEHSYGVYARNIAEYLAAVSQNHYWRNITLGELKTAVARNAAGEIIYEVVYSEVIDNIANMEPGASETTNVLDEEGNMIYWERLVNLGLGPKPLPYPGAWYTDITYLYTSYADLVQLDDQSYFTSLTPGYARLLYPNSLLNMRNRVAEVVGQEFNSKLLPLWMTSQQKNGSTLGYTQAWVICYTKPNTTGASYAETIKNNIQTQWTYTLNQINFKLDRFSVDKSLTYNYINGVKFDIQTEDRVPILTEIPSEEITTEGIPDPTKPPQWMSLPSASPPPVPLDSDNFYVLFPRQTILPDETQY